MKKFRLSKVLSALLLSSVCVANATTLQQAVDNTIMQNPELKAISYNIKAFDKYIDEAYSDYKPKVDMVIVGESKKTKSKYEDNATIETDQGGYNADFKIEQLLFDGGLTSARIDEAVFRDKVNKLLNQSKYDSVILNSIHAYLDLVKYDLRLTLSQKNLKLHEEYLVIAKDSEALIGEVLDTFEVKAKLHLAKKNYFEEVDNNQIAQNSFFRLTGSVIDDGVVMPTIDTTILPDDQSEILLLALSQNTTILAQKFKIDEQRAIIDQEDSKFMPTLKLHLGATANDDLMAKDTEKQIYSAKLAFNYNFYSGGRYDASQEREIIFLQESKQVLVSQRDLITDEINSTFTSFKNTKKKINELKEYASVNEEIVKIYKNQFEAGTRTFVDILDMESDLYNVRVQLIDEELKLAALHYTMLSLTSNINSVINK